MALEYQWKVIKDTRLGWLWRGEWESVQTVQSDRQMIDMYRHQPATTDTDNYFNIYTSGEQGTTLHHLNNWTPQSYQTRRWWKTPSLSPYVVVHIYVHVCVINQQQSTFIMNINC